MDKSQIQFCVKGLIFDLDGTLVDSVPDLVKACNQMLTSLGRKKVNTEKARLWIGDGAQHFVEKALMENHKYKFPLEEKIKRKAFDLFQKFYLKDAFSMSKLYPGVYDFLRDCESNERLLACVTNKPANFTYPLLQGLKISNMFDQIVCGDDLPKKKPDPMQLNYVAKEWGVLSKDCVLIGDSMNDIIAGQRCSMPVAIVSYGYSKGEDVSKMGADAVIDSFHQIKNIIEFVN
tara:strand:+ start:899 stop:1597 length:699 start_codon:yes stop_codon:yes gene_type:complete